MTHTQYSTLSHEEFLSRIEAKLGYSPLVDELYHRLGRFDQDEYEARVLGADPADVSPLPAVKGHCPVCEAALEGTEPGGAYSKEEPEQFEFVAFRR